MSPDFLLIIIRWDLLFLDERNRSLCSPIPMLNVSAKLPKNLDAILVTHTNVLSEIQLPGTLNDVRRSKENGKPPHHDVLESLMPSTEMDKWTRCTYVTVVQRLDQCLLFRFCLHVQSQSILSGRFSREHFLPMEGGECILFWNGLCMCYFWMFMNSILQFFFCTRHACTYIYMIWVFPSSQRHYFQALWTMWNRLNIHTHPWAQKVRPISNCHSTFIFIPHPESDIQWFLSQMWSILTKHTAISGSSVFFLSLSLRCTCVKN